MKDNILEIKDLVVEYITDESVVHAVNGMTLCIERGGMVGLVGETGAGKTTTALSIMGLLPERNGRVRSGEILLDGQDLLKLTDHQMDSYRGKIISMIYQDPMTSLNPTMTVGRQIGEVLRMHNICDKHEVDSKVKEILEIVGISGERQSDYPHQFSGGMKQRVVIAMALACNPVLLIADEPTTALDVTIQAQVLDMISKLKERMNTSMLMITHDLGIVGEICDNMAIMYAGEIVECGDVEDVFTNPMHPYLRGLLDSVPDMNSNVRRLKPIAGLMPDPTAEFAGCRFCERCFYAADICSSTPPPITKKGYHQVRCHVNCFVGEDEI